MLLEHPRFAILGATLTYTCTAQGIGGGATVEEFKWYHNQTEITAEVIQQRNSRFIIRDSGRVTSILSVSATERQDGGEYHCQVFISGSTSPVNSTSHTIKIEGMILLISYCYPSIEESFEDGYNLSAILLLAIIITIMRRCTCYSVNIMLP